MKKWMIIIIVILLGAGYGMYKNSVPPANLGLENGVFKPLRKTPNGVSTQAQKPSEKVPTLKYKEDLSHSKAVLIEAFNAYGSYDILVDEALYMHVVFSTEGLGFKDDVEIYFDEKEKQIHYKSQSRVGYSDMGVNRRRYEAIKKFYEE
jgi:uncharacterized protein (DUF1499 family)